jgi:DNA-binding response OmpR family regulator
MTASFRAPRARPPISAPIRPANRPSYPPPPEANEVTVSITVRGDDAISAIAPLMAAVQSMHGVDVSIEAVEPILVGAATGLADRTGDRFAPLHIRVDEYSALLDGVELNLTRREFDLLRFLAEHPRRVFSRSQLLQAVWGYDFSGGGRTVDVHIRRLRQKLGSRGPSISTVRGVGYRLDESEHVFVLGTRP